MSTTKHLYNVTISVNEEAKDAWLSWMLDEHLKDMLATGCFLGFRFCQLQADGAEGPTYTVQYELASTEDMTRYERDFAPALRNKSAERFGNKALAYRSHMTVLAQGSLRNQ